MLAGSFFPVILRPRRRIDQALYAVVVEAYVNGVSTRSAGDLVAALGVDSGISKSEVSRICAGVDEVVAAFRDRRLDHVEFPYVYLDATYLHVRNSASQVVSMAGFWRTFLTSLKTRGLGGVKLVISDQHAGLVALRRAFGGTAHQRCRVHFARTLLAPRSQEARRRVRRGFPHRLRPARHRHRRGDLGRSPGRIGRARREGDPVRWSAGLAGLRARPRQKDTKESC